MLTKYLYKSYLGAETDVISRLNERVEEFKNKADQEKVKVEEGKRKLELRPDTKEENNKTDLEAISNEYKGRIEKANLEAKQKAKTFTSIKNVNSQIFFALTSNFLINSL